MTKRNLAALAGFLLLAFAILFYWYLRPRDLNSAASSMSDFHWNQVHQITVRVADPARWFTGPVVSEADAAYTLHCEVGGEEIEELTAILYPVSYTHQLSDMFRRERASVPGSQGATVSLHGADGAVLLSITMVDGDAYLGGLNGFFYSMKSEDGSLSGSQIQQKMTDYVIEHGQAG